MITSEHNRLRCLAQFVCFALQNVRAFDEAQNIFVSEGNRWWMKKLQKFVHFFFFKTEGGNDSLDLNASLHEAHFFIKNEMVREHLQRDRGRRAGESGRE